MNLEGNFQLLPVINWQVQSYGTPQFISISKVSKHAEDGVQHHDEGHGDDQHAGAAQEVLRLLHRVLHRHHHADPFHREDHCTIFYVNSED